MDLTDAALLERIATVIQSCSESGRHGLVLVDSLIVARALLPLFIVLREAARAEQREADATIIKHNCPRFEAHGSAQVCVVCNPFAAAIRAQGGER